MKIKLPDPRFLDKNSAIAMFWIYLTALSTTAGLWQHTQHPWLFFLAYIVGIGLMHKTAFMAGEISANMKFRHNLMTSTDKNLQILKSELSTDQLQGGILHLTMAYGKYAEPARHNTITRNNDDGRS